MEHEFEVVVGLEHVKKGAVGADSVEELGEVDVVGQGWACLEPHLQPLLRQ